MIIQLLLQILISGLNVIFGWLPDASTLPFGIDEILVDGVGQFKALMALIPPLETVFTAFMIYLSFRLGLILLKVFLGNRTPQHD